MHLPSPIRAGDPLGIAKRLETGLGLLAELKHTLDTDENANEYKHLICVNEWQLKAGEGYLGVRREIMTSPRGC